MKIEYYVADQYPNVAKVRFEEDDIVHIRDVNIVKTMTYAMVKEHTYEEILNVMTGSDWWIEEPLGADSEEA